MLSHRHPDDRLTLQQLHVEYALSDKTWRRALVDPIDPLPHQRASVANDPRHARILVKRGDVEAWIARRSAALSPKSIVDEIVEKALA